MEKTDSNPNKICVSDETADRKRSFLNRASETVRAQHRTLEKFLETENGIDSAETQEHLGGGGGQRRRKKSSGYRPEFNYVSAAASQADLNEIYGAGAFQSEQQRELQLVKNDPVTCILNRKKYKGTIFQVNFKELVIKTQDRKKIKIKWENIDGDNIKIIKARNAA